jgi:hypothetical protein
MTLRSYFILSERKKRERERVRERMGGEREKDRLRLRERRSSKVEALENYIKINHQMSLT